jgi:hypothetical protein
MSEEGVLKLREFKKKRRSLFENIWVSTLNKYKST